MHRQALFLLSPFSSVAPSAIRHLKRANDAKSVRQWMLNVDERDFGEVERAEAVPEKVSPPNHRLSLAYFSRSP